MSSLAEKHWARQYDESIGALFTHRQECAIELGSPPHLHELKLHLQGACCSCYLPHHLLHGRVAVSAGMPEGSNARHGGKSLLEQLQPLGGKLRAEERHPGDVPTRPREAGREAVPDRVAHDRHHDGDSSGRLLCSEGRGGIAGENEIEIKTEQLRRQLWESLDPSIRSPVFDDDVLPLHIPALAQSLPKGVDRSPLLGRLK